jgi:hypothetical protein
MTCFPRLFLARELARPTFDLMADFYTGCLVRLAGLEGTPHLNGAVGTILGETTLGRYPVHILWPDEVATKHSSGVKVKGENMVASQGLWERNYPTEGESNMTMNCMQLNGYQGS